MSRSWRRPERKKKEVAEKLPFVALTRSLGPSCMASWVKLGTGPQLPSRELWSS